jgi:cyclopropane fatty-acyl-phospholipid synthase-like methyltransferase
MENNSRFRPGALMKSLLGHAAVYSVFAKAVGAKRGRRLYVDQHIRPRSGFKILDIGCGPGDILEALPLVDYHGFDLSSDYITSARRKYGDRGHFSVHSVNADLAKIYADFDLVLATGVLHHLDDSEAKSLFELALAALREGGRLVTLDGCYMAEQSFMARFLLKQDRGQFVRTEEGYLRLARSVFSDVESTLHNDLLRIPYTHIVMECRK